MFKLVLEKAEEPEIKLPTSAGSWKKQESSKKTSLSEFSTVYCDPHSQRLWHSHKAVDSFLELSCFFDGPMDVGNLISGSSAFSKTCLNIWKLTVHVLLKPGLDNYKHYLGGTNWAELGKK